MDNALEHAVEQAISRSRRNTNGIDDLRDQLRKDIDTLRSEWRDGQAHDERQIDKVEERVTKHLDKVDERSRRMVSSVTTYAREAQDVKGKMIQELASRDIKIQALKSELEAVEARATVAGNPLSNLTWKQLAGIGVTGLTALVGIIAGIIR